MWRAKIGHGSSQMCLTDFPLLLILVNTCKHTTSASLKALLEELYPGT